MTPFTYLILSICLVLCHSFMQNLCLRRSSLQTFPPNTVQNDMRVIVQPKHPIKMVAEGNSNVMEKTLSSSHVYGDTGGAVLLVEDAIVSAGDTDLIKDVNWKIMPKERVALVGTNGAGKSTLLRSVIGEHFLTEGKVILKPDVSLGHLRQTAVSGSVKTVFEEASSEMKAINDAEKRLVEIEELCEKDPSEKKLEKLAKANDQFVAVGGATKAQKVGQVLQGLGFTASDHDRLCTEFSGGWQMRVGLARLLLSEPTALLLDEPTNHLDLKAKEWLADYLARYEGAVVVVTHDEGLLEKLNCNAIAEVRSKKLHYFRGNYKTFLKLREERVEQAKKAYLEQQREIEHLESFINRFGAKATKASAAQSRVKKLEKMERLEAPEDIEKQTRKPSFKLPSPPVCATEPLTLSKAAFGWGDKPLLRDITLELERGCKYVLLGPNGVGKSTLLKALAGNIPLLEGSRREGKGLELGVFTQDLAQDLPAGQVALDHVLEVVRSRDASITNLEARNVMGALGLIGNMPLRKIGMLSGGEKARVALAIFCLIPHNVLLLDEPSNHLDVATMNVLVEALREWEGTAVVISHNAEFCKQLGNTHVGIVGGGTVKVEERELRDSDWKFSVPSSTASSIAEETTGEKILDESVNSTGSKTIDKETRKSLNVKRNRVKKIEQILARNEEKLAALEEEMMEIGGDTGLMDLYKKKEKIQEEDAKMYEEWEVLEEEITRIEIEYGL
mmetsp:Transcript_5945/g.8147  ORF Transcript_5945/g.8147 Transcript_5945/m.8147 type:complete len:731 (-) Transcript_5945:346-2538(-)